MQGTEIPTAFPAVTVEEMRAAVQAQTMHDLEPPASGWTQDAPPLRFNVTSLQHWIDLSA